ncbi:MAG: metallophosphoesterase [Clostridia bacterium]|nr:metallophosphoesterase [Clostridia bacterium]
MTRKNAKKSGGFLKFLLICAVLFLLVRLALYDGIAVRRYTLKTDAVSREHRFVLITDLHSTVYGENQGELAEKILAEKPEAVFLVGDIADDVRGFDGTAMLLERLKSTEPDLPLYYVTGNHERWVEWGDVNLLFEEHGAVILSDRQADLGDGIRLSGVADPLFYEDTLAYMDALLQFETGGKAFDILLAHRPEFARTCVQAGFELTLSGHAHGGQVRIPLLLNGLYAPNQGWLPKYAGGLYDLDGGHMIVSRGLMIDDLPRIFNPPEIVMVEIRPEVS